MKKLLILVFSFLFLLNSYSQTDKNTSGKYTYITVKNDPLKARIYTLDNGLKIYMSVNKDAPRIQTRITVKAGSKNDPADATGLAHYLEHMLFKGTSKFGTKDYDKEKEELNRIISLYETYRVTTDDAERKKLYHQIDSISLVASGYAIPNEYDKMLGAIGATGTNAYTTEEQTTYINDIPSNQIDKWLVIESERFRQPVMRLFHTELEVVYEEKNRSLDNGMSKAYESLYAGLFQKHSYGTQTTIGTIEHLKNPSLQKVIDYYNTYYVPNNMAICLAGDFDMDKTIELIDKYFGKYERKQVPEFISPVESPIDSPIIKEVYSPDAENLLIGFRFPGIYSEEADLMQMLSYILYNNTAGLFDLNLVQTQKVLNAYSYADAMKDYSIHMFSAAPRSGQTLDELKDLMFSQIDLIKKGDFPEWYIQATINNLKSNEIRSYENNPARVGAFVNSFIMGIEWDKYVNHLDKLSKIKKDDIVKFANKYYKDNYVMIYKRTGEDKNVVKVVKPEITPVNVNRETQSDFYKNVMDIKSGTIEPVFLDYKKDFKTIKVKNQISLYYVENKENNRFELYYVLDMGTNNNVKLNLAVNYLQYLGTSKMSLAEIKKEFFKIGCGFSVSSSETQTYISLSGLKENFEKGVLLFENLLSDAQPNPEALKNLVDDILKKRTNAKLSKNTILFSAMTNYGMWGEKSPFTNILSESELKNLKPEELISIIKNLNSFQHDIIYYGPESGESVIELLNKYHNAPDKLNPVPEKYKFVEQPTNDNNIYVVNYDMKQVEIIMLSKSEKFSKENIPVIKLFNEYFGSGMSSILFQELREAKALAYSVNSRYSIPSEKDLSHFNISYIGTQNDKLNDAMTGLTDLLNNMPESEVMFNSAKVGAIEQINTQRIMKAQIIFNYLNAKKLGIDYDIRKDSYNKIPQFNLSDIKNFHDKYIKDKNKTILVLGDVKKLDISILEKFGKVHYLTLEQIFNY